MRTGPIEAVTRKDLANTLRNKGVRVPLLVAPTIILVVLPALLVTGGDVLISGSQDLVGGSGGAAVFTDRFTPEVAEQATGISGEGRWAAFVLKVFLAPLYLLIPLMVSTVIAADSFAGERDRGTLEALLHTPTTDGELFTAKFLAAWLPAIAVSLGGFVVYSVVANVVAWPTIGHIFFPDVTWLLLAFVVAPGLAALGLGVMVIVSSRVSSLQAAHQFGSLVVLPVILLLIAQVSGAILIDTTAVLVLGALVWVAVGLVMKIAVATFTRQRLTDRL